MKELSYDIEQPAAALATPWGAAALAVIRTAGTGCIARAAACFSRPAALINAPNGTALYGWFKNSGDRTPGDGKYEDGTPGGRPAPGREELLDQVVMLVFRPPHGYTGQESVEIICHGGLPGIQAVLQGLKKAGFRDAAPGEFTMRAFLNGKMDLTRAEAVNEIVGAKSSRAHTLALNRLSGGIENRINRIKDSVAAMMSLVEVHLDYPEDELGDSVDFPRDRLVEAIGSVRELADGYRIGKIFQEGVKVALAGKTNSGKSSLFNLFLREDRSIVSELHGTTRDYIESWISIGGIPVRLFDTAGIRFSDDPVETEGIRRSGKVAHEALLVLYLFDGTEGPAAGTSDGAPVDPEAGTADEEIEFFRKERNNSKYIFLWNKADIAGPAPDDAMIPVSAVTGQGFHEVETKIRERILSGGSGVSRAGGGAALVDADEVIDSQRQKELLDRAAAALETSLESLDTGVPLDALAVDLKEGLDALGEITGEVTTDDILDRIFSGFCLGK